MSLSQADLFLILIFLVSTLLVYTLVSALVGQIFTLLLLLLLSNASLTLLGYLDYILKGTVPDVLSLPTEHPPEFEISNQFYLWKRKRLR